MQANSVWFINAKASKLVYYKALVLSLVLWLSSICVFAQDSSLSLFIYDSNYYKGYEGFFTGRLYSGNKYLSFNMIPIDDSKNQNIRLRPNTNITLGVGATYKWLTINIAFGFDFINSARDRRGETRYLDLQTHLYGRRNIIDLYGQFYRGYYGAEPVLPSGEFHLKPEMRVHKVGMLYEHIANWKRFSMRASVLQSERQLKSAGSLLYGGSAFYTLVRSDSGLIFNHPELVGYPNIYRLRNFSIGPSLGYGYTLVALKNFFLTVTGSAQPKLNFADYRDEDATRTRITVRPGFMARAAIGYSHNRWTIAGFWINDGVLTATDDYRFNFNTGMLRIAYTYRFVAGPRLQKRLRFVETLEERVIKKILEKMSIQPGKRESN